MARKVFISVLGATNYGKCDYQRDNISFGNTRFIQVATLNYIQAQEWDANDIGYILLTKGAAEKNWEDNGQIDYKTNEHIMQPGLQSELTAMKLPFRIEPVKYIPEGNNEQEIWQIFDIVFNILKDEDELYIDFTHGYRYMPMLLLVMGSYAKFLKRIIIRSITYGNFEISERGTKPGLIVDLLPLTALQDWTYAAGQYLENGNANLLAQLSKKEIIPILANTNGKDEQAKHLRKFIESLEKVVDERTTCRGLDIIRSTEFAKLKTYSSNIDNTIIAPLNPIISKIKNSLVFFTDNENTRNAYSAAVWCYNNKLYQQAATILQEFVVSFLCERHGIKIDDESRREIINQAFILKINHEEKENGSNWAKVKDENKDTLRDVLNDALFDSNELVNAFNHLTTVRNDYNHSGMRSQTSPLNPDKIKKAIEQNLLIIGKVLFNIETIIM